MSQRKAPHGNGFFRALSIVVQHGRQLAVPLSPRAQAHPTKTCPRCGCTGRIDRDFGTRVIAGKPRPQSWCRSCRRASERTSAKQQLELIAI